MGLGDEIIASGHARTEWAAHGDPNARVEVLDRYGKRRWSDVWRGSPIIAGPTDPPASVAVTNGAGCRPYIDNSKPFTKASGWSWSGWRVRDHVGELFLDDAELEPGRELRRTLGAYVVVEPFAKPNASPNKTWPVGNFAQVIADNPGLSFVQPFYGDREPLDGVLGVPCGFRVACGLLASSRGYLGTDGALHHAAAALGVGAVVIFGGCTSEEALGYPTHRNLVADLPGTPCGRWLECDHCLEAMRSITPDEVGRELRGVVHANQ